MKQLVLGIFVIAAILASLPQTSTAASAPKGGSTVIPATPTPEISRMH